MSDLAGGGVKYLILQGPDGVIELERSKLLPMFTDADLLGELVRRGIYPLDFMRWLGQHPVGPDGTAYFVGTGREPIGESE